MYGCCRWLRRVQRGATSLAYWGIFSVALQCGSDKFPNKLRYFPSVNTRAAASPFPLHFQPSLFRWLYHPSYGLDLLLLCHRFCRLGQGLATQVIVQVFVPVVVVGEVPDTPAKLSCQLQVGISSCLVIVKQAVDAPVPVQYIYGFGNIGNRIEDDVILPVKVGHGRAVPHPQREE